jgi:hypothetical protein
MREKKEGRKERKKGGRGGEGREGKGGEGERKEITKVYRLKLDNTWFSHLDLILLVSAETVCCIGVSTSGVSKLAQVQIWPVAYL